MKSLWQLVRTWAAFIPQHVFWIFMQSLPATKETSCLSCWATSTCASMISADGCKSLFDHSSSGKFLKINQREKNIREFTTFSCKHWQSNSNQTGAKRLHRPYNNYAYLCFNINSHNAHYVIGFFFRFVITYPVTKSSVLPLSSRSTIQISDWCCVWHQHWADLGGTYLWERRDYQLWASVQEPQYVHPGENFSFSFFHFIAL